MGEGWLTVSGGISTMVSVRAERGSIERCMITGRTAWTEHEGRRGMMRKSMFPSSKRCLVHHMRCKVRRRHTIWASASLTGTTTAEIEV